MKSLDKYLWSGHTVVMGKRANDWQDVDYVLNLFCETRKEARKRYRSYVEKGLLSGRRPELTGGGLLRSFGGWSALSDFRKAGIRLKGDERILGDSGFVDSVLRASEEQFERKYLLKAQGYDFEKVVNRVAEVLSMKVDMVLSLGKSPKTVKGRSLLCYWANRELGMTTIQLAKRLNLCQSAVSRSSARGEKIAKDNKLKLIPKKA